MLVRLVLTIELSLFTYALVSSGFDINKAIVEFVKINIELFNSIKDLILNAIT
jgi:hypothetical protein